MIWQWGNAGSSLHTIRLLLDMKRHVPHMHMRRMTFFSRMANLDQKDPLRAGEGAALRFFTERKIVNQVIDKEKFSGYT